MKKLITLGILLLTTNAFAQSPYVTPTTLMPVKDKSDKPIQAVNITCDTNKHNYILTTYTVKDPDYREKVAITFQPELKEMLKLEERVFVNGQPYAKVAAEHKCNTYPRYSIVTSANTANYVKYSYIKNKTFHGQKMISSPYIITTYEGDKLLGTYIVPISYAVPNHKITITNSDIYISNGNSEHSYKLREIRERPFYFQFTSRAID